MVLVYFILFIYFFCVRAVGPLGILPFSRLLAGRPRQSSPSFLCVRAHAHGRVCVRACMFCVLCVCACLVCVNEQRDHTTPQPLSITSGPLFYHTYSPAGENLLRPDAPAPSRRPHHLPWNSRVRCPGRRGADPLHHGPAERCKV